jgi:hypothetical protein
MLAFLIDLLRRPFYILWCDDGWYDNACHE